MFVVKLRQKKSLQKVTNNLVLSKIFQQFARKETL